MTADSNKAKYEARPWLKFYGEGVPPDAEIPEESVVQAFDEATERWKDKTAVIFYGRKMNYRDLREEVDRFATALHDLGVRKGDRVALLLLNSPQFIIAYFGTLKAGGTVTAISPLYVSPEIKHQLEDTGARVIVCQDILYKAVEKTGLKLDHVILTGIGEYLPGLKKFLGADVLRSVYQKKIPPPAELYDREGFHQLQSLIKKYPPEPPQVEFNVREDIASLPYTGGTTGLPKAAMISHYNLNAARSLVKTFWSNVVREGEETIIAYLPFYHIYGEAVVMFGGLSAGQTLVIFATHELDDILNAIESHKATVFYSVPGLYEHIRHYYRANKVDWKRIKLLVSGADALSPATARGWQEVTGSRIHEGWGMTETTSAGMVSPYGRPKEGSFGIPLPNTMAAIVDPENTNFLPVGERGELVVRGPQLARGYWGNVEESCTTFALLDGQTWLRTCDLASMDEEGYFHFYDRKRDMIKYKGLAVFAREVEDVLVAHPSIREAVVVGVPDPDVGERVKAVVVLDSQARGRISDEDIINYCAEKLAHYKIPKIVEFRDELPRTATGKLLRRELREAP